MSGKNASDYKLFFIVLVLIGIGIIMIYSSSAMIAYENFGDSYYYLKKQLVWFIIGIIFVLITVNIDYHFWDKISKPLLIFGLILLGVVLIPRASKEIGIARRWIEIGGFRFQPTELIKLIIVIYMASSLSRKQREIEVSFSAWFQDLIILGLVCGLVVLQPDFGTAVILGGTVFIMFFVSGVKLVHLFSIVLSCVPLLYFLIFSSAYRMKRFLAFFNPWQDPQASGFQIIQSFLAFGSGGTFGLGLGESKQKLFYLPEAHTDFIFSIVGEELGFVGALAVIIIFIGFLLRAGRIVFKAKDSFGCFLSLGILTVIGLEFLVNISVVLGMLPTKGTPLPFISYGGSSLIFTMASVGILLNISKES
ncbi:MAG: putative lipid II flippase FtsW [bacterium]|nr:putative lipid II flippase FtsW [bacterium]